MNAKGSHEFFFKKKYFLDHKTKINQLCGSTLLFKKKSQWSRQAVETIFLKTKNFRLPTLKNENWESPPIFY